MAFMHPPRSHCVHSIVTIPWQNSEPFSFSLALRGIKLFAVCLCCPCVSAWSVSG
jgi:hypothetical protein